MSDENDKDLEKAVEADSVRGDEANQQQVNEDNNDTLATAMVSSNHEANKKSLATAWIGIVPLILVLTASLYFSGMPEYHQFPIFVAPGFTAGVAFAITVAYLLDERQHLKVFNDNRPKDQPRLEPSMALLICSMTIALFVIFFCFAMSAVHSWQLHLLLMIIIYLLFLVWDIIVLKFVRLEEIKEKVRSVSKSVNIPTLCSLVAAAIFVFSNPEIPTWTVSAFIDSTNPELPKLINSCVSDNCHAGKIKMRFDQFSEAIVTGVIAFHLIAGALGYIIEEYGYAFMSACRRVVGFFKK
ncbi:MAG: hypothetical protein ACFE0S_14465 [Rhodospirillales bacterium]